MTSEEKIVAAITTTLTIYRETGWVRWAAYWLAGGRGGSGTFEERKPFVSAAKRAAATTAMRSLETNEAPRQVHYTAAIYCALAAIEFARIAPANLTEAAADLALAYANEAQIGYPKETHF